MRISPVLFLLPVLVLSGSCIQTVPSAKANDDRPALPQPAIASPVAAPLTIESLAGTYKAVIDEQELTNFLKGLDEVTLRVVEKQTRQTLEHVQIKIQANGTFESQFILDNYRGNVKINGRKLVFTANSVEHLEDSDDVPKVRKCDECYAFTLNVSSDGKTLLYVAPKEPGALLSGYVKQ